MLLKLTCPSCGRSDQASDRVIGKEVRCPCGATFRVLGPKPGAIVDPVPPEPAPRPVARQSSPPPRSSETRSRPASSNRSQEGPPSRPRSDAPRRQPSLPEPPRRAPIAQPTPASLPPWAFAAFGGGAVLFVVAIVALILSLNSSTTPTSKKPDHADDRVAANLESPQAQPADDPPAATAAPTVNSAQPVTAAATTETSVSSPVTPAPASTPLTTAQIVARCEPSVALIKGKVSSGTGFLVRSGVVATNAHVIEEEFVSNLEIRFPSAPAGSQGPISAQLLYEDRKRDIAFLAVKSDLPMLRVAPLIPSRKVKTYL